MGAMAQAVALVLFDNRQPSSAIGVRPPFVFI